MDKCEADCGWGLLSALRMPCFFILHQMLIRFDQKCADVAIEPRVNTGRPTSLLGPDSMGMGVCRTQRPLPEQPGAVRQWPTRKRSASVVKEAAHRPIATLRELRFLTGETVHKTLPAHSFRVVEVWSLACESSWRKPALETGSYIAHAYSDCRVKTPWA